MTRFTVPGLGGPSAALDRGLTRRRFLAGTLTAATGIAALAACGNSTTETTSANRAAEPTKDGDVLNLYAWSGYYAPEVLDGFQREYGITIAQTATSSVPEMLQKLTAQQPFDLAIANSTFLPDVIAAGLLQRIDPDMLTNYDQLLETFHTPYYDPEGRYCLTYAMGGIGLAYRQSVFPHPAGSWADIWSGVDVDPKHVYLFDDYQLTLAIALMYLGLNPNTDSQNDLNQAVEALRAIAPSLGGFGSTGTVETLSSGQATMAASYTGDVLSAIRTMGDAGADLQFTFAREGQLFNADTMTIPTAATHPGNAMLFLDYMLRPDNMAANVDYTGYPVPTTAGMKAYDQLVADVPFLQLDTAVMDQPSSWQQGLSATQRPLWNAAWLKVRA